MVKKWFMRLFIILLLFSGVQVPLLSCCAKRGREQVKQRVYSDDDFLYFCCGRAGSAANFVVLSKSLMSKFHPNFSGVNCQLVVESYDGLKFYSSLNKFFCSNEKDDIYISGFVFFRDSRAKVYESEDEFREKMAGKECTVSLFENSELIRSFKVVCHENGTDDEKVLAKNVAHLNGREILKFNKIADGQREKRKEEFLLKKKSDNKDLDFSSMARMWFGRNCILREKLDYFIKCYKYTYGKFLNSSLKQPLFLTFANVKGSEFFKQKAYIYFSPTWFIENFGLSKDENFENWVVEIEGSDGSVFRPRFKCLFGPFPDGDFCLIDASVCNLKLNGLLKTHKNKGKFKFLDGKTYKVRFYRNGKIAKKNLVAELKVKAKKDRLKNICIGRFDNVAEMCGLDLLKKFAHPAEFNEEYYRNLLVNYGANEICWS